MLFTDRGKRNLWPKVIVVKRPVKHVSLISGTDCWYLSQIKKSRVSFRHYGTIKWTETVHCSERKSLDTNGETLMGFWWMARFNLWVERESGGLGCQVFTEREREREKGEMNRQRKEKKGDIIKRREKQSWEREE